MQFILSFSTNMQQNIKFFTIYKEDIEGSFLQHISRAQTPCNGKQDIFRKLKLISDFKIYIDITCNDLKLCKRKKFN